MQFLAAENARNWCEAHKFRVNDSSYLDYGSESLHCFSISLEDKASRVIALVDCRIPTWPDVPFAGAKPTDAPYAQFGDPQSLNLYAYVYNNPNIAIDLDGHFQSPENGQEADALEEEEEAAQGNKPCGYDVCVTADADHLTPEQISWALFLGAVLGRVHAMV